MSNNQLKWLLLAGVVGLLFATLSEQAKNGPPKQVESKPLTEAQIASILNYETPEVLRTAPVLGYDGQPLAGIFADNAPEIVQGPTEDIEYEIVPEPITRPDRLLLPHIA